MKNFKSKGNTLEFTASAAISSGDGVLIGAIFGVAAGDVANGEVGVANLTGTYNLNKTGTQAWTVGARVYWDDTNNECTTTATGNTLIGVAAAAVAGGAGDTLGDVRLNGSAA